MSGLATQPGMRAAGASFNPMFPDSLPGGVWYDREFSTISEVGGLLYDWLPLGDVRSHKMYASAARPLVETDHIYCSHDTAYRTLNISNGTTGGDMWAVMAIPSAPPQQRGYFGDAQYQAGGMSFVVYSNGFRAIVNTSSVGTSVYLNDGLWNITYEQYYLIRLTHKGSDNGSVLEYRRNGSLLYTSAVGMSTATNSFQIGTAAQGGWYTAPVRFKSIFLVRGGFLDDDTAESLTNYFRQRFELW